MTGWPDFRIILTAMTSCEAAWAKTAVTIASPIMSIGLTVYLNILFYSFYLSGFIFRVEPIPGIVLINNYNLILPKINPPEPKNANLPKSPEYWKTLTNGQYNNHDPPLSLCHGGLLFFFTGFMIRLTCWRWMNSVGRRRRMLIPVSLPMFSEWSVRRIGWSGDRWLFPSTLRVLW